MLAVITEKDLSLYCLCQVVLVSLNLGAQFSEFFLFCFFNVKLTVTGSPILETVAVRMAPLSFEMRYITINVDVVYQDTGSSLSLEAMAMIVGGKLF